MKKNRCFLLLVFILIGLQTVFAEIKISVGIREKVVKIYDFPNEEEYTDKGKHFDLGLKYEMFGLGDIPLYQEGKSEIVGYLDKTHYLRLTADDLRQLLRKNNIDDKLVTLVKIPFWDAWGGKLVMLCVFLFLSLLICRRIRLLIKTRN